MTGVRDVEDEAVHDPLRRRALALMGNALKQAQQPPELRHPAYVIPARVKEGPKPRPSAQPVEPVKGLRDAFRKGDVAFARESDPFRTASRVPKPKPKIDPLTTATDEAKEWLLAPLNEGQILWRNVPLLGSPGSAKTSRALTIACWIGEHYGWKNVNIVVSDDLMALAGGMKPVPVNVLIVDDALRKYQSRGGTTTEMKEAMGKFVELRHELEDILSGKITEGSGGKTEGHIEMTQKGIVFCLFTAQMYKGLEKTFRDGLVIFCSTLVEDREAIMGLFTNKTAEESLKYARSHAAWSFLEKKTHAIEVKHEEKEKRWAIAALPMTGPGIIEIPWYKTICMKCKTADHNPKKPCPTCGGAVGFKPESVNPETGRQYVTRVKKSAKETPGEMHARLSKTYAYVAQKFLDAEYDPMRPQARALLQVFLREWCSRLATGEEEDPTIRSTDWMVLVKKSGPILEHAIKLKHDRAKQEHAEQAAKLASDGVVSVNDDDLVEYVCDQFLMSLVRRGLDPEHKKAKDLFIDFVRARWKKNPSLRDRIQKFRQTIMAAAVSKWLLIGEAGVRDMMDEPRPPREDGDAPGGVAPDAAPSVAPDAPKAPREAPRAPPPSEPAAVRTPPVGSQFTFDPVEALPRMVDRCVKREVSKGKNAHDARIKWERRAVAYQLNKLRTGLDAVGQPTMQREWRTWFGPEALRPWSNVPWGPDALVEKTKGDAVLPPITQRGLSDWVSEAESAMGDMMGEEYELWVCGMLRAGWRPSWLKPVPVAHVEHGGGAGHTPDVRIVYANGDSDFVSLKCYRGREYITLNVRPLDREKHVHVAPEVQGMQRARHADPLHEHRVVIMARDLDVDGMEAFAVLPEVLPESVKFSRSVLGTSQQNRWVPPSAPRPAVRPPPEDDDADEDASDDDVEPFEEPDEAAESIDEGDADEDDAPVASLEDAYARARRVDEGGDGL